MSEFEREHDRYAVIKIKDLTERQREKLDLVFIDESIPTRKCVVVEESWPNYEDTWTAIEQVVNGEYVSPYERNKELEETVKRQERHLSDTGNISAYRVGYRCRFCAAGAASDYNVKAFYNCHVCKAPAAMIPENMHAELMELLVKMDTLLAQRDQAITLLNNAMTARQQAAPRVMHQVSTALDTLRKEFDPQKIKQLQDEGLTESSHRRTPLNRLIDACPEYVQQHIWHLRALCEWAPDKGATSDD